MKRQKPPRDTILKCTKQGPFHLIWAFLKTKDWCCVRGVDRSFNVLFMSIPRHLWMREVQLMRNAQRQADILYYEAMLLPPFLLVNLPENLKNRCAVCNRIKSTTIGYWFVSESRTARYCEVCTNADARVATDHPLETFTMEQLKPTVIHRVRAFCESHEDY